MHYEGHSSRLDFGEEMKSFGATKRPGEPETAYTEGALGRTRGHKVGSLFKRSSVQRISV